MGIPSSVTPKNPKPGGKITVDFYWECLSAVEAEGDWKIFVHVEGPTEGGKPARVIADHYAVEDGSAAPDDAMEEDDSWMD